MTQEEKERLQYQISVMHAYREGKTIQVRKTEKEEWHDIGHIDRPAWNWQNFDYRVKPELPKPKYRPFESAEEVMKAIKEHSVILKRLSTSKYKTIREYDYEYIWIGLNEIGDSYKSVFENYTFADDTPFGKLIEE